MVEFAQQKAASMQRALMRGGLSEEGYWTPARELIYLGSSAREMLLICAHAHSQYPSSVTTPEVQGTHLTWKCRRQNRPCYVLIKELPECLLLCNHSCSIHNVHRFGALFGSLPVFLHGEAVNDCSTYGCKYCAILQTSSMPACCHVDTVM